MSDIDAIYAFWLTPEPTTEAEAEARKQFWFGGGGPVDQEIRDRFGALVADACAGRLDAWTGTPRGTLALILLIDQFTRNVHRGRAEAYAHDSVALDLCRRGFEAGRFDALSTTERLFAALPFRHAEDIDSQKKAVDLAVRDALRGEAHLRDFLVYSVDWARKHLDVIVRFGRFPHRNAILGRASTPAELQYLDYLKLAGQWL